MTTVIPDSIQPYVGYKALRILKNGTLCSPQQDQFGWPVGKRAEALCARDAHYIWVKRTGQLPFRTPEDQTRRFVLPQVAPVTTTSTAGFLIPLNLLEPPPPAGELGPGEHWSWEIVEHLPADANCSCGIYVVEKKQQTFGYCKADSVVCEVAVWGQVTVGYQGARGQYAYPQKMFIPEHLSDVAPLVADLYGIETQEQDFKTGAEPRFIRKGEAQLAAIDPREDAFLSLRDDARKASLGFACISVAFYLAALATYLGNAKPAWVGAIPLAFAMLATAVCFAALADSLRKYESS